MTDETWPPPPEGRREPKHIAVDVVDIVVDNDLMTLHFRSNQRWLLLAAVLSTIGQAMSIFGMWQNSISANPAHPMTALFAYLNANRFLAACRVISLTTLPMLWYLYCHFGRWVISSDGSVFMGSSRAKSIAKARYVEVVSSAIGRSFIRVGFDPEVRSYPLWNRPFNCKSNEVRLPYVKDAVVARRIADIIGEFMNVRVIKS